MIDESYDIVIANARLLLPGERGGECPPGTLCIQGDRIERILGPHEIPPGPDRARRWIDAQGDLLMPGLVNTHTHAAMALLRGLADDLPLAQWLQDHIFPVEARAVDEAFVYWGTLLACAEMIRFGTTAFCDGYFHEGKAMEAVKKAGLRALCAQGVLDFPSPDCADPSKNVDRAVSFVRDHLGDSMVRPGIFCHSPYTCSPDTLRRAKEACRRLGVPFLVHLAETRDEVREIQGRYGTTPVRHLDRIGLLDPETLAVHCIWLDREEIDLLVQRGVRISIATQAGMKLASGIAPLPAFLKGGASIGIGTDGAASNNNLDLFREIGMTARLHKVREMDPTLLRSRELTFIATMGGARVLGMEGTGEIREKAKADLVLIDLKAPHLQPCYHPFSQIAYAARGSDVRTTIVGGRILMEDRKLLILDEEEIFAEAKRIQRRMASIL